MDHCTICDRPRNEVKKLVSRNGKFLCNRCIEGTLSELGASPKRGGAEEKPLLKPREIKDFIGNYVISQDHATREMSVAVYNHYKRREALRKGVAVDVEIDKSNILILGPSGSGKTEIARTIARVLGVPFYVGDATKLTISGYVGDDVETLLQGLLSACDGDVEKAQWGIVFLDEFDKLARKSGRSASGYRDITGEGVQQALLKMIEGSRIAVPRSIARVSAAAMEDLLDTKNILFIMAGSFAGIEDIVKDRVNKKSRVGFGSTDRRDMSLTEVYKEVREEDILEFGIIPELLGRIPVHTTTLPLTEEEMVRILTEPKNSIIKQAQALFAMDDIDLDFTEDALLAIGKEAISRPTGARALRSIVERVTKKYAFDGPSDPTLRKITVTKETVDSGAEAILEYESERVQATG